MSEGVGKNRQIAARKGRKGIGGPKSARGKAIVRLNPLRHGVLSQTPVIPLIERVEDWERLRDGVRAYFHVEGVWEEALADRIAMINWRLLRVIRFETESILSYLLDTPRDWRLLRSASGLMLPEELTPDLVEEIDRMLMGRLIPGDETLDKVLRYETKLHRFLLQTQHQLEMLKARRKPVERRLLGNVDLDPPGLPAGGRRSPVLRTMPFVEDGGCEVDDGSAEAREER